MRETKTTFCRICEALCGLEVTIDDGRVVEVRPDERHVATDGFACMKGLKQQHLYDSPDRLRYPMKRIGSQWQRVSWPVALEEIAAKVNRIRGAHSPNSIAMYVGTAAGFSVLHPFFAQGFMDAIGSKSMYASATQDCASKFAASRLLYGFPFTLTFPDVERTDCLIVVGANPVISKWSFLQVSHPGKRLKSIEARGGRVFVVDPRKTETAKVAGEHVFIRPNTDVFFFLSFLQELIHTGGVDAARVAAHMNGFDEVRRLAAAWPAERTAPVTGISVAKLREMVDAYRRAKGAALYCSTGVNMGSNGTLAFWLQEVINAVSCNLDRRGGTLVGKGVFDFPKHAARAGKLLRSERSRIGGLPSVNDAFPGGVLADEILTPGTDQVRALFVTGGNPLITMPNSARLRQAFEKLELLVCLDIFRNETASLAHYLLPCTTPFERPDLPFLFPLLLGLQSRPYLQATEAMVRAEGEPRDEATIYFELCRAAGLPIFGAPIAQRLLNLASAIYRRRHPQASGSIPQEALLSLLLRLSGQGSFASLLAQTHGRLRPDHLGGDFLGQRLLTADGRVQLAPAELLAQARKLDADFEAEQSSFGALKLITRRAVHTHNSWTHNAEPFVSGGRDTNYLYMHPGDAAARGLADGDLADVHSATAMVRVPVQLLDDLMPGTVALPHGWGHQHATGLGVASRTRGVNANLLAADGPQSLERVSGMAHLTGIVVRVEPAAGPRAPEQWSGVAPDSACLSTAGAAT